jgi:glutathione S-transferase
MGAAHDITLWHVPISHYSEKARWALDYKRVPHSRRAVLGGLHPLVTWILTRGQQPTVPVVTIDGRSIGDSSAVIAELEERFPDPPLYPRDPDERRRALELEDWFDEECGPYIRRLAYHEVTGDPEALAEITTKMVPWVLPQTLDMTKPMVRLFLDLRFSVRDDDKARAAEEKVMTALDRLEAELDGREFLAGDSFSVADLTAAAILYPLVLPPEGPWQADYMPPVWGARMDALRDRPGLRWVADIYAHHRRLPAGVTPPAPSASMGSPGKGGGPNLSDSLYGTLEVTGR